MMEFKFIDLFAGIGGFHLGLHENGGHCVFASEIDKFARITYEENFKKISPDLFRDEMFAGDINKVEYKDIPVFNVLCAGFPCQPFSFAGLKKGFNDDRGNLFFNIRDIAKMHRPEVLFLENVKGLRGHDKGNTFRVICEELDKIDYQVASEILNSKNFGVPQNRERIFIIAWDRRRIKKPVFNFPMGLDHNGDPVFRVDEYGMEISRKEWESRIAKTSVGEILFESEELRKIEKKEGRTYTISEKLWEGHKRRKAMHKNKGNGFGYSEFKDDDPYTSTISARYYKDGSEILINQSAIGLDRPRKLHPIEAARLQGYPAGEKFNGHKFVIPVSNNQAYKQFGNSVSVPVISTIANQIVSQLLVDTQEITESINNGR